MTDQELPQEIGDNQSQRVDAISPKTDPLWTVEEVARYLNLQPETIREKSRKGELPAIKVGRVWRFQKRKLTTWLEKNTIGDDVATTNQD
jgi:excisionase family DNA binding protein